MLCGLQGSKRAVNAAELGRLTLHTAQLISKLGGPIEKSIQSLNSVDQYRHVASTPYNLYNGFL